MKWQTIKKLIKDCLTENDGQSFCPIRCFGAALTIPSVIIFIAAAARVVFSSGFSSFPFHDFSTSFSIIIGGIGVWSAGITAKAFTDTQMGGGQ
jgi:hypothetical protein